MERAPGISLEIATYASPFLSDISPMAGRLAGVAGPSWADLVWQTGPPEHVVGYQSLDAAVWASRVGGDPGWGSDISQLTLLINAAQQNDIIACTKSSLLVFLMVRLT